jgi:streptomycin 6-kinase
MTLTNRLDAYLVNWNLSQSCLLTQTVTSHIYTVTNESETRILKLHSVTETEEQVGALALRYFGGQGAVRLLRHDDGAQLMEYADGDDLMPLMERGEDERATRIIAGVIRQLHCVPQETPHDGLFTLERWFRELFRKAAAEAAMGEASIFGRGARVAARLLADQREVRVLHGDIHHRNIRGSARGWLAFDPKGLVGERTYDCANTLCNPELPHLVHNERRLLTNAGILANELTIDVQRVLAFTYAYACLSPSWSLGGGDAEAAEWALKVARIVEQHLTEVW